MGGPQVRPGEARSSDEEGLRLRRMPDTMVSLRRLPDEASPSGGATPRSPGVTIADRAASLHLVNGLVSGRALMAPQKMTALAEDPKRVGQLACTVDDAGHVAEGVLLDILAKLRHDHSMFRHYSKLGRFSVRTALLLVVIALQLGVFVRDYTAARPRGNRRANLSRETSLLSHHHICAPFFR